MHQGDSPGRRDSLAEWSKALAQGASPQGRGFEPHSCHFQNMAQSVGIFPARDRSQMLAELFAIYSFLKKHKCVQTSF